MVLSMGPTGLQIARQYEETTSSGSKENESEGSTKTTKLQKGVGARVRNCNKGQ